MQTTTYSISEQLMQAIVQVLNTTPCGQSRQVLNAIEHACTEQDKERAAKADADLREQIKADLQAEVKGA